MEKTIRFITLLQRYSEYFHKKNPNSKLIIWNGTHYDILSLLIKQRIFFLLKEEYLEVNDCEGISLKID